MYVWMYVDPREAVKAGKGRSGVIRLNLTDEELASLTDEEREELAKSAGLGQETHKGEPGGSNSPIGGMGWHGRPTFGTDEPRCAEATLESLRSALQWRTEARQRVTRENAAEEAAKKEANRKATLAVLEDRKTRATWQSFRVDDEEGVPVAVHCNYAADPGGTYHRIGPAWPYDSDDTITSSDEAKAWYAELEAENERRKDEALQQSLDRQQKKKEADARELAALEQYHAAVAALVEEKGSESQRARYEEDLLPGDELRRVIYSHLFGELEQIGWMSRYNRLTSDDLCHDEDCYNPDPSFDVDDADELDSLQYDRLLEVRKALPEGATAQARAHVGSCDACDGAVVVRHSIRVMIPWHGKDHTREYGL